MEEDVNYTRSLKMNLTRSGYLPARSVEVGASENKLPRETATESPSRSPAGNITAPGVSPNSFSKSVVARCTCFVNARWPPGRKRTRTEQNSRKLSPVLDFSPSVPLSLSLSLSLSFSFPLFLRSSLPSRPDDR